MRTRRTAECRRPGRRSGPRDETPLGGRAEAPAGEPVAREGDEAAPETRDAPPREPVADDRGATSTPRQRSDLSDMAADDAPALLPADDNSSFQRRWEELQTAFVDEPRQTVEQADELVAQVMKRLAEGFATERERLEAQWGRGEDISTEDLRIALQRYRAFFQRLLSA